jgi:hypothetical protein
MSDANMALVPNRIQPTDSEPNFDTEKGKGFSQASVQGDPRAQETSCTMGRHVSAGSGRPALPLSSDEVQNAPGFT